MVAIRVSRLFDGDGFTDRGATVVIDNDGRIAGVEAGFPDLAEHPVLAEYTDATALPGLIDTHVHLVGDSQVGALDRVAGYSTQELDEVVSRGLREQLGPV